MENLKQKHLVWGLPLKNIWETPALQQSEQINLVIPSKLSPLLQSSLCSCKFCQLLVTELRTVDVLMKRKRAASH